MRLIYGIAVLALCGAASAAETCPDTGAAYKATIDHVMFQLKSPFSAEFPEFGAEYVTIELIGQCEFSVSSYVDAKNTIGRTVRQGFSVRMSYTDDEWQASDLVASNPN